MLSFIIPAWNEERLIERTIRSIQTAAEATGVDYEIVMADDASDDRTGEIAAALGACVVRCENRQIAATRNAGARASRGDRLVFVDADTFVPPEVVQQTVRAFETGAVAGTSFPRFDGRIPLYARLLLGVLRPLFHMLRLASGAYLFCTRAAFDRVGGFDESYFAAEEAILARRLHRCGRFQTVRGRIVTSGRKIRTFTALEILKTCLSIARPTRSALRTRHDIWYTDRRNDPDPPQQGSFDDPVSGVASVQTIHKSTRERT